MKMLGLHSQRLLALYPSMNPDTTTPNTLDNLVSRRNGTRPLTKVSKPPVFLLDPAKRCGSGANSDIAGRPHPKDASEEGIAPSQGVPTVPAGRLKHGSTIWLPLTRN
jgi:hypothetical protein